jgi:thioredoxin reductase
MSRALTAWSRDVLLCTDGPSGLTRAQVEMLERNGVRVVRHKVQGLESRDGKLTAVRFKGGLSIPRKALFFNTPSWPQSPLAAELGCKFAHHGGVLCGKYEATSVPGVYVAGNIIRDVQLAIVAAAEGTRAAFGINRALTCEDFSRSAERRRSGS